MISDRFWQRTKLFVWGLALILAALPISADRRDQKAADLYSDAVKLIKKREFKKAIPLLQEALDRGATEPNEQQGSQTRFLVYQYDPYYWLGVAFMETNEEEKAQLNFDKSEASGVIRKWPDLYSDLTRRKETLEKKLSVAVAIPAPVPARPTPTSAPVVAAIPTKAPEIQIVLGDKAGAKPSPATPAGAVVSLQDLEALRSLEKQVTAWLSLPGLAPQTRQRLVQKQTQLQELSVRSKPGSPRDVFVQAVSMEGAILRDQLLPSIRRSYLENALASLSRRDWNSVDQSLDAFKQLDPSAPQSDIVRFVAQGTRFLLENKKDPALLEKARQSLTEWRKKTGPDRPLPAIVSPALKALIES